MSRHLTDLDIAVLVEGAGSDESRHQMSEHLGECPECRSRIVFATRLLRASTSTETGSDEERLGMTEEARMKLPKEREAVLMEAFRKAGSASPPLNVVELQRVRATSDSSHDPGLSHALAADGQADPAFPTLSTEDGTVSVRFRRTAGGERIRAYLVGRVGDLPRPVWIRLGDQQFLFDERGLADMGDIAPTSLESGVLEMPLRHDGSA